MAAYYVDAVDKLTQKQVTIKVSGGDITSPEKAMAHVNNLPGSVGGKHPGFVAKAARPRDAAPAPAETPAPAPKA